MAQTTTTSSGKTQAFSKEITDKFDGMLDLISEKNSKIGRLAVELEEARELLIKLVPAVEDPLVKRSIRLKMGSIERLMKEVLH